ncbi:hypothetical protein EDB86DRAFT_2836069 [Lactarius hatsudake]|nr:hypothetical protein EDB86DRAFT_2836069 [Lactarius hatsudake]
MELRLQLLEGNVGLALNAVTKELVSGSSSDMYQQTIGERDGRLGGCDGTWQGIIYRHGLVGSVSWGSPPLRRPYGYIYVVDHPSWTSVTALDNTPIGIPQVEDLHAFIALNGDLAPHPAEYTNTITNRLFYRPLRIAASSEA